MKQFGIVLRFELKSYFKNKGFVGVTLFLVLLICIVMFYPRITSSMTGEISTDNERPVMLIVTNSAANSNTIDSAFSAAFKEYDIQLSNDSIDKVQDKIISGDVECAFVFKNLSSYTYYVENLSMGDTKVQIADEVLQNINRINEMVQNGIPANKAEHILSKNVEHKITNLGKDQMQNFFYTYIMIFALYMVILLYGQMIATNVASEKSSRAMELLVTSTSTNAMMFGKVISSCIVGLTQLICIFGSAILFYNINKTYWGDNIIINSIFDMPVELLLYMCLFFILGFFVYAFMYGAVGSTVSKLEDINTAIMPISILFVISFIVVVVSLINGDINNMTLKICSFVPFTSPMAMFTRIAMSTVPIYEIIISVSVLTISAVLIGFFSSKIYRMGVLLYGTRPTLKNILSSMKRTNN